MQEIRSKTDMTSCVFDETECQSELSKDIDGARGRILIASPFVTVRAVGRRLTQLEAAIKRGVSVCAIIQEPTDWQSREDGSLPADGIARLRLLEAAVELLQSIGVHVTLRPRMHEKLIAIDDCILWEGSINFLSWFNTTERARRWSDRAEVADAIKRHKLLSCSQCLAPSVVRQLAKRRIALGLRQAELARIAGTHRWLISAVELEKRDVRVETLNRICDALGLEVLLVPKHLAQAARHFVRSKTPLD